MNRCRHCSSTFVRPVRPSWWQWLRIRLTSRRPHECWHCGWRGWLPLEPPPEPTPYLEPTVALDRPSNERSDTPMSDVEDDLPAAAGSGTAARR